MAYSSMSLSSEALRTTAWKSRVFGDLIFSLREYLKYQNGKLVSLEAEIEELVSPNFPKSFPKSTLLYYYMTVARDFRLTVIQTLRIHVPAHLTLDTIGIRLRVRQCVIGGLDRKARKTDIKRRSMLPRSA